MNRFLTNYNSAVVGSTTSGDNIPSATIKGININNESFLLGIFVGIILAFLIPKIIKGIINYIKFIKKDNEEMAEKLKQFENNKNKSTKSDE